MRLPGNISSRRCCLASNWDDAALVERARADLARIFPLFPVTLLHPLAVYRIPLAQFDQPPGIYPQLPPNTTVIPGLFAAGEYTESSSIHGAMHSGEKAAAAVLAGDNPPRLR